MEDIITYDKKEFSIFDFFIENDKKEDKFLKNSIEKQETVTGSLVKLYEFSTEDSSSFLKNILKGKDTILNENWDINENIKVKILSFD